MARIRWWGDGTVSLTFKYHADLIEDLKAAIPPQYRDYDPDTKTWAVSKRYAAEASRILLGHFPYAEVVRPATRTATVGNGEVGDYAVLYLLPTAPPEVVLAAYRALAKANHPDLLPEHQRDVATKRMQSINAAYGRLNKQ